MTDDATAPPPPPRPQTAEELVAKSIAPIKKEFLCPAPTRISQYVAVQSDDTNRNDRNNNNNSSSNLLDNNKKSKRQQKRERQQEKMTTKNICPVVARTADANACPFADKCRFSHDIEAFKAQKPADLEGECPFLGTQAPCAYGLGCRFAGTHKVKDTLLVSDNKSADEINTLNKDVQKLLWKNKMSFPKADAKLKSLGLLGPNAKKKMAEEKEGDQLPVSVSNGDSKKEDSNVDEAIASDDLRPIKKTKSEIDGTGSADNVDIKLDEESEKSVPESVLEAKPDEAMIESDQSLKMHPREKKLIDFREKLYLAPLTTVGNLPFRRVCKGFGADVTCGEMAMCTNLLQGQASEWALLRRHSSEDLFGVQICGSYPDTIARVVEMIDQECSVDFIDINMGCPIDIVVNKGAGSCLLNKPMRIKSIIETTSAIVDTPITVKVRTGYAEGKNRIDSLIADIGSWGAHAVTIHGRSRQQRYSKLADWDYIHQCARKAPSSLQVIGNGDVYSYLDWNKQLSDSSNLSSCMIARGALVKPWLFTEIKEQRNWDISSAERFDILKEYVRFGMQHWGSDTKGVETTRHFLLEWLSYTCRYVPLGLLEVIPPKLNWRPPSYYGRDDLETLLASESAADWVRISEMLLGKVPDGFTFAPKHKSNSYDAAENG
ncbi:hypothetical protein ACFE04_001756 [Oxalis oulophora]